MGGGVQGGTGGNERPGTDPLTSGPMRGLEKTAPDGTEPHTDRYGDSMSESAQWGRFSENNFGPQKKYLLGILLYTKMT